jgi:hypothetical protein
LVKHINTSGNLRATGSVTPGDVTVLGEREERAAVGVSPNTESHASVTHASVTAVGEPGGYKEWLRN